MNPWPNTSRLAVFGRYVAFAGVVAAMVPICIPYVVMAAYRSWRRK